MPKNKSELSLAKIRALIKSEEQIVLMFSTPSFHDNSNIAIVFQFNDEKTLQTLYGLKYFDRINTPQGFATVIGIANHPEINKPKLFLLYDREQYVTFYDTNRDFIERSCKTLSDSVYVHPLLQDSFSIYESYLIDDNNHPQIKPGDLFKQIIKLLKINHQLFIDRLKKAAHSYSSHYVDFVKEIISRLKSNALKDEESFLRDNTNLQLFLNTIFDINLSLNSPELLREISQQIGRCFYSLGIFEKNDYSTINIVKALTCLTLAENSIETQQQCTDCYKMLSGNDKLEYSSEFVIELNEQEKQNIFRNIVTIKPMIEASKNPYFLFALAKIYYQCGDYASAFTYFETTMPSIKTIENLDLLSSFGQKYYLRETNCISKEQAIFIFKSIIRIVEEKKIDYPNIFKVRFHLLSVLYHDYTSSQREEAIKLYKQIAKNIAAEFNDLTDNNTVLDKEFLPFFLAASTELVFYFTCVSLPGCSLQELALAIGKYIYHADHFGDSLKEKYALALLYLTLAENEPEAERHRAYCFLNIINANDISLYRDATCTSVLANMTEKEKQKILKIIQKIAIPLYPKENYLYSLTYILGKIYSELGVAEEEATDFLSFTKGYHSDFRLKAKLELAKLIFLESIKPSDDDAHESEMDGRRDFIKLFSELLAENNETINSQIELFVKDKKEFCEIHKLLADLHHKEKKYDKAFTWYKKAADNTNTMSCRSLGWYYLIGLGTAKNIHSAFDYFKTYIEAYKLSSLGAIEIDLQDFNLDEEKNKTVQGEFYLLCGKIAELHAPNPLDAAIFWFEQARKRGNADAKFYLASKYYAKEKHSYVRPELISSLQESVENGFNAALLALKEFSQTPLDKLNSAQKKVLANSAYVLGELHCAGRKVVFNFQEAIFWFEKARQLNHPNAQLQLAMCFKEKISNLKYTEYNNLQLFDGISNTYVVETLMQSMHLDSTVASEAIELLIAMDVPEAKIAMALAPDELIKNKKTPQQKRDLLSQAAESGSYEAQYYFGKQLFEEKKYVEAIEYIVSAARSSYQPAIQLIETTLDNEPNSLVQLALGKFYFSATSNIKENTEKAIIHFAKAAENNSEGSFHLAMIYLNRYFVDGSKTFNEGITYLALAIKDNYREAKPYFSDILLPHLLEKSNTIELNCLLKNAIQLMLTESEKNKINEKLVSQTYYGYYVVPAVSKAYSNTLWYANYVKHYYGKREEDKKVKRSSFNHFKK